MTVQAIGCRFGRLAALRKYASGKCDGHGFSGQSYAEWFKVFNYGVSGRLAEAGRFELPTPGVSSSPEHGWRATLPSVLRYF